MTPANDPKKMDAARETLAPHLALFLTAIRDTRPLDEHASRYDERIAKLSDISVRDRALLMLAPGMVRSIAVLEAMDLDGCGDAVALVLRLVDATDTLLAGLEKQAELDRAKTFRPGLRSVGR